MAKRKRKNPGEHPEALQLLEEAKRFGRAGPKQHHLVPAFYLNSWTEQGLTKMTDLDGRTATKVPPKKAAKRSKFYSLESDQIDPEELPPLLMEYLLSRMEGEAKPLLDRLADAPNSLTSAEQAVLASFLGYQFVRGARTRDALRESTSRIMQLTTPHEPTNEDIERILGDLSTANPEQIDKTRDALRSIASGTTRLVPQDAALVGSAFEHAQLVGFHFYKRQWVVYETHPLLITTDEPVVPISGPGGDRKAMGGPGVAGVVVFPLRPDRLLAMVRRDLAWVHPRPSLMVSEGGPLDRAELVQVNRELAANAYRYTFELPSRGQGLLLKVPQEAGAWQQDDVTGKVTVKGRDDCAIILRSFTPNRWMTTGQPPDWPVDRWWPQGAMSPHEYHLANQEEMQLG